MKAGIVSDSHGNPENLKKAAEIMVKDHGVEIIIHLGDDSHEIDVLRDFDVKLMKVPGVYEENYKKEEIPNRIIKELEGWKCLFTHTRESHQNDLENDIKPEEVIKKREADIVFFGHSHIPCLEKEEGILFVNPGHLKPEDKKGFPPAFSVAEINSEQIKVKIIELSNNKIFKEMELSRNF